MEQKIMKLLLIQLKLMALACVAAMTVFLFVAFKPVKAIEGSTCKKSACIKEKEVNNDVRETFFFGKLFAYSNFGTN